MKITITDCDHGFFEPEHLVVSQSGGTLSVHQCLTPAEVIQAATGADALLCQYASITREVLCSLPRLRVVGRYGVGVDNVDLQAATELGIPVIYAPDFCAEEVADHTLGLILALSRQIVQMHLQYTRRHEELTKNFSRRFAYLENVRRTRGRVLGLIGFGRIGKAVGQRARAFGYRILVHDRYVTAEAIQEHGFEPAALDDLLRESDVVSLHCPVTPENRGLIGSRELSLMKPSAFLINASRGALVDESSLADSLVRRRLAGAALDVTQDEPLPAGHPLLGLEQVILSPHIAFYSRESVLQLKKQVAQSVVNILTGNQDVPVANPAVLKLWKDGNSREK